MSDILKSERLIIRKTIFDDCEDFSVWEKDINVTRYFSLDTSRTYEDVVTDFVLDNEDLSKELFTIVEARSNRIIGRFYNNIDKKNDAVEIYRVYIGNLSDRGKGYGQEALEKIMEYYFESRGINRLYLDHYLDNKPAENLYLNLGFKNEGIIRDSCKKEGEYYSVKLMSILRNEYFELQ